MVTFYRSRLNQVSITKFNAALLPNESQLSTVTSCKRVDGSTPRFSRRLSVYTLLIALGGIVNPTTAIAVPATAILDGEGSRIAGCAAKRGDGSLDWLCLAKGDVGSVGLLSMQGTRDEVRDIAAPALAEDSVAIGREVSTEGALGSIAIGAGANANSPHGIAIGKGARVVRSARIDKEKLLYAYMPVDPIEDGGIAIGEEANTVREGDVVIGKQAGQNSRQNTSESGPSLILGAGAGRDAVLSQSVFLGRSAGDSSNGYGNTAIGYLAGHGMKGDMNLAIGYYALGVSRTSENDEPVAVEGRGNIGIGSTAGMGSHGSGNLAVGNGAGSFTVGNYNLAFGAEAGYGIKGGRNITLGDSSGRGVTGSTNVIIGDMAGEGLEGNSNTAVGTESAWALSGENNVSVGYQTSWQLTGSNNVAVGDFQTAKLLRGDNNVVMGAHSGSMLSGSGNVLLGSYATKAIEYEDFHYRDMSYNIANDSVGIGSESNVRGDNSIAIGHASTSHNGGIAIGAHSEAILSGGVAIGKYAVEGQANPFASGTIKGNTYRYAGAAPESVVSVGNVDAERQITNVAAGRISATSTDAINGSQLYAVHQAIEHLTVSAAAIEGAGGGSWNLQVNGDTPTAVEPFSTVGLNAGNNIQLVRDGNAVSVSTTPNIKVETVKADAVMADSVAAGSVSATDTLRVAHGPALMREGIDAANKAIVNVANGEKNHDAVNVAQLNQSVSNLNNRIDNIFDGYNNRFNKVVSGLNNRIDRVAADADAGSASASAIANLPQSYLPGKNAFAIATAGYRGQQGYAAGLSRVSPSGNWIVKGSLSGNSRGHLVYGAGVAYQW